MVKTEDDRSKITPAECVATTAICLYPGKTGLVKQMTRSSRLSSTRRLHWRKPQHPRGLQDIGERRWLGGQMRDIWTFLRGLRLIGGVCHARWRLKDRSWRWRDGWWLRPRRSRARMRESDVRCRDPHTISLCQWLHLLLDCIHLGATQRMCWASDWWMVEREGAWRSGRIDCRLNVNTVRPV